jgi:NOL1/NOP2/sun family putative RNA methylase
LAGKGEDARKGMQGFDRYRSFIPDFPFFQAALQEPLPIHLRINTLKAEPSAVVSSLAERGVYLRKSMKGEETLYEAEGLASGGNLIEYFLGYVHPQALTSCLSAMVLGPEQGAFVLDLCAAPGGKTAHLAQLMKNTGLIVANELHSGRLIPLGHTLDRLGVMNAVVTGYQAQEFPLRHRFDYVLADVPCSSEGRFRQVMGNQNHSRFGSARAMVRTQQRIIVRGFDLLKEGGRMVYATCTYNPEENEAVVDYLLKCREATLLPLDLGLDWEPGLFKWEGAVFDEQLRMAARFYPHRVNSVGFFMPLIGRRR